MGDADSFSTHFKACAGRMLGLGLWTMFLRCGGAACGGWLGGDEFHLGLLGSGRHRDRSCRLRRFARGQFGGLASLLSELRCGCFRRGCLSRETILLGSCRGGLLSGETFLLDLNRAYNPPCAFSEFTTCPLPPRQNILTERVEAGEKYPPLKKS